MEKLAYLDSGFKILMSSLQKDVSHKYFEKIDSKESWKTYLTRKNKAVFEATVKQVAMFFQTSLRERILFVNHAIKSYVASLSGKEKSSYIYLSMRERRILHEEVVAQYIKLEGLKNAKQAWVEREVGIIYEGLSPEMMELTIEYILSTPREVRELRAAYYQTAITNKWP